MAEERFTVRELSHASGVSVASIKFYVREGLVPPGDSAAEHRAHYDERHLARLRAIRALREIGQLPLGAISDVFRAIDDGGSPFAVVASVMDALSTSREKVMKETKNAGADIRSLLDAMGVRTRPNAGAVVDLGTALVKLRTMWGDFPVEKLRPYAEMAHELAKLEVEANREAFGGSTEGLLRTAVLGTVLFEPVLIALRRLMHEDLARSLLQRSRSGTRAQHRPAQRGKSLAAPRQGRH